jgi:hypothetical protein
VRWVLVHRTAFNPVFSGNPLMHDIEAYVIFSGVPGALHAYLRQRLVLPEVTVWELPGVSPLAFTEAQPARALPVQYTGQGADVDLRGAPGGGAVIINALYRQWMVVEAEGRRVPAAPDSWGRIRCVVPPGSRWLQMRYRPPWRTGLLVGLVLAVASVLAAAALTRGCPP